MSAEVDMDMSVLEHLDFEPGCDSNWHEAKGFPPEAATHMGRYICPRCGPTLALMGPTCIAKLVADRQAGTLYRCSGCNTIFPSTGVTLDRL